MECQDVVSLRKERVMSCMCGNVKGIYKNDLDAVFCTEQEDKHFMMGFANPSLQSAVHKLFAGDHEPNWGIDFAAFVIPEPCNTFTRIDAKEFEKFEKSA